jgi:hypothetical protein
VITPPVCDFVEVEAAPLQALTKTAVRAPTAAMARPALPDPNLISCFLRIF